MTTQPKAVPPIPEGYHSVTPWIISRDTAKLLDFMSKAFGAQELGLVYNEDGAIGHAEAKQEMAKRATEKEYLDAMRYAQESLDREMKRRSEAAQHTDVSR
jgi:hypothetical protein